jgi:hypothetical protein
MNKNFVSLVDNRNDNTYSEPKVLIMSGGIKF